MITHPPENAALVRPVYDDFASHMAMSLSVEDALVNQHEIVRNTQTPSAILPHEARVALARAVEDHGIRRVGFDMVGNTGIAGGSFAQVYAFGERPQILRIALGDAEARLSELDPELPPCMLKPISCYRLVLEVKREDLVENLKMLPDRLQDAVLQGLSEDEEEHHREVIALSDHGKKAFDVGQNPQFSKLSYNQPGSTWREEIIEVPVTIETYPMVRTTGVTPEHIRFLQDVALMNGFVFTDTGRRNVGLLVDGTPVIIDPDGMMNVRSWRHGPKPFMQAVNEAVAFFQHDLGCKPLPGEPYPYTDEIRVSEKAFEAPYIEYLKTMKARWPDLSFQEKDGMPSWDSCAFEKSDFLEVAKGPILNHLYRPPFYRYHDSVRYDHAQDISEGAIFEGMNIMAQAAAIRKYQSPALQQLNEHFEQAQLQHMSELGLTYGKPNRILDDFDLEVLDAHLVTEEQKALPQVIAEAGLDVDSLARAAQEHPQFRDRISFGDLAASIRGRTQASF